jgi:hypothetical protein
MGEARVHQSLDLLLRLGHVPEAEFGHVAYESLAGKVQDLGGGV